MWASPSCCRRPIRGCCSHRRAPQLRIFPNLWVPPGGHVEPDESLLDAGLRELEEETGLRLDPEGLDPQILGLWESVFPPLLSRGPPQRHHIVVYMLLKTPQTHQQLQASLSPAPSEVSACLWADGVLAKAAVDGELRDQQPISVTQVSLDGSLTQTSVPAGVFSSVPAAGGPDLERLSTGTKFALELWLRTLKGPD
ncbi:nucleoside diphosphate-linked moiety X motif 17-like isoform 5-T6 [Menidia menidia]